MSQKTVQLIIGRLLTDEELRQKFLVSPVETLSTFRDSGLELTNDEIAALTRIDRGWWTDGANRIDARLQRCCLKGPSQ
jgi:hypothetical protein